jgi:hypothetical protein
LEAPKTAGIDWLAGLTQFYRGKIAGGLIPLRKHVTSSNAVAMPNDRITRGERGD